MGENQTVVNALIQLYAAGTTGPGSASTPLLTATVNTDAVGSFSLANLYRCPTPTTPVYITATGGNPGLPSATNNTALALMAALGPCGSLTPSTFISINEVSTVAAIWSASPFIASATQNGQRCL